MPLSKAWVSFWVLSGLVGFGTSSSLLAEGYESQGIEVATQEVKLPEGFLLERVFEVPQEAGSWVALTSMGEGKLAAADQYGGVYQILIEEPSVEIKKLDVGVEGIHGLLWFDGSLFVSVNELEKEKRGVYRVTDRDGDGVFEQQDFFQPMETGGEHGIHALVPSPDEEWVYLVSGNYNKFSDWDRSWVPENWGEDQLLPRNADGRGHARGIEAPAGKVIRFKPDGTQWELVSIGFRNPYDGAFNEAGEFFVYDADMEWDFGMPWYRPTRLCWAMPGAEYGWRHGTGKWPEYYEDSLPGVAHLGPGSPTGVVSGRGFRAPSRYQKCFYCFDWTFATIYAVTLKEKGSGYAGRWRNFWSRVGFR